MKVKFTLGIGFIHKREEIVEFEDDATEEEIEAAYLDWQSCYLAGGWTILTD